MKTSERVEESAYGDDSGNGRDTNTASGDEKEETNDTVGVVRYKHSTDSESQIIQQVRILCSETMQTKMTWHEEGAISAK